jgi:hypothetical protein
VLFYALVLAIAAHFVASILGGISQATTANSEFAEPAATVPTGIVLEAFGAAAGSMALLGAVALGLVLIRRLAGGHESSSALGLLDGIFVLTLISAVVQGIGMVMLANDRSAAAIDTAAQVLSPVGYFVLAAGGSLAVVRLRNADARAASERAAFDTTVFAVDRSTGNVFVYLSVGEAERKMSVYSVEDDEFDFYADDGGVLTARVVDNRTVIEAGTDNRRAELLAALRAFVQRRGIDIGAALPSDWDDEVDSETIGVADVGPVTARPATRPDPDQLGEDDGDADNAEFQVGDDPLDYAAAIREWQWRELWPPWLRPFSPLLRRLAGI